MCWALLLAGTGDGLAADRYMTPKLNLMTEQRLRLFGFGCEAAAWQHGLARHGFGCAA